MKEKRLLMLAVLLLALTTSPAFAVGTGTTGTGTTVATKQELLRQKQQIIAEKKEKMVATKCAAIEKKIQARETNFNEGKTRRLTAYNNMKDRLTRLEVSLAAKGYDTTKLRADTTTLSGKISQFSTDYGTYIAALGLTNNYACGKSEGEFRAQLLESRDELATVLTDAKDIKTFYKNTIKIDLQAIRAQTPTAKGSGGTAASGDTAN